VVNAPDQTADFGKQRGALAAFPNFEKGIANQRLDENNESQ
jgi:hypothetical protein